VHFDNKAFLSITVARDFDVEERYVDVEDTEDFRVADVDLPLLVVAFFPATLEVPPKYVPPPAPVLTLLDCDVKRIPVGVGAGTTAAKVVPSNSR
jgi:hypothetical protein